ncbi:MAG: hypothetical protein IT427_01460 [Pirellulales bacterium]|nr:hypothetical protein [Pirellulales bacterium]
MVANDHDQQSGDFNDKRLGASSAPRQQKAAKDQSDEKEMIPKMQAHR